MSATTLNTSVASSSFVEVLVNLFKSFVSKGKSAPKADATWAEGARFM